MNTPNLQLSDLKTSELLSSLSEEVKNSIVQTRSDIGASIVGDSFDLHTFLSDVVTNNGFKNITIPEYAYHPSSWTKSLLRGLEQIDVSNKKVLEVGFGSGVNLIYLLRERNPKELWASDYDLHDGKLADLALQNIQKNVSIGNYADILYLLKGRFDLARWVSAGDYFDLVYACIPQAIKPGNLRIEDGDNLANYYDDHDYKSAFNIYGLGLNDCLLKQAKNVLKKDGEIVLNLGGRPGKEILEKMFTENEFIPELIHEEMIEQEKETCLEGFINLEKYVEHPFEFFDDISGKRQIDSSEAEVRRQNGKSVYHKIYVYKGKKS